MKRTVVVIAAMLAFWATPASALRNGQIVIQLGTSGEDIVSPLRLVSVRPDGTQRRELGRGLYPSATRGGQVAFDQYCTQCSLARRLRLVIASASGRILRRVGIARSSAYPQAPIRPSFSHDGRWLAYA